jgi:uncharacterized membrane protein
MAPLIVLVGSSVLLRALGRLGVEPVASWRAAGRGGCTAMFLFTGSTHFSAMKHDYAAMIPDPLPKSVALVYATGVMEAAGGIGLQIPRTRRIAGICLASMMAALFPANVTAARKGIPFQGKPPTPLWLRTPAQVVYAAAIWWSSIAEPAAPAPGRRTRRARSARPSLS